jgi:hypothetical protein
MTMTSLETGDVVMPVSRRMTRLIVAGALTNLRMTVFTSIGAARLMMSARQAMIPETAAGAC